MAAVEAGVPVVPITINDSRSILPPGDWKVRSGEIEIIFGVPIPIQRDGTRKAARLALLTQVETAIAARVENRRVPADGRRESVTPATSRTAGTCVRTRRP